MVAFVSENRKTMQCMKKWARGEDKEGEKGKGNIQEKEERGIDGARAERLQLFRGRRDARSAIAALTLALVLALALLVLLLILLQLPLLLELLLKRRGKQHGLRSIAAAAAAAAAAEGRCRRRRQ